MARPEIEYNKIYCEPCLNTMKRMAKGSVNLVMTSPPYADARKSQYGGVAPDQYLDWIKPIAKEIKRVLALDGSFILNLGDITVKGETHLFTFDLPGMFVRELGYSFIDSFIWHKKNPPPGGYPNRFKDAWEFLYHFSLSPKIKFRPFSVAQPAKEETIKRYLRSKENNQQSITATGSGMTSPSIKMKRRLRNNGSKFGAVDSENLILPGNMAFPSNVLYMSAETVNQGHSAPYPVEIPIFFIKALTDVGDVVYDPFTGSGTTGEAALRLDRKFIGSEILAKHVRKANNRILPHLNPIFKTK